MAGSVFVARCGRCTHVVGAYDPARSTPSDMGNAVRWAAKFGGTITLEPSPVTVVLCTCSAAKRETSSRGEKQDA